MLSNELPFEIIESPERIAIIGEQAELARTIYMNTDKHASDIEPAWNGNSIGKWVDGVLVVDVAGFNDRVTHIPGTAKGSTTTHIVEKFKVVDGGKALTVEMTFDDPKLLTKPTQFPTTTTACPRGPSAGNMSATSKIPNGTPRWASTPTRPRNEP